MTSLDILYISLSIGFLVLVGFIVYLILKVVKTLEPLKLVLEDLDDTTSDIRGLKDQVKVGTLGLVSMFLGKIARR